MMPDNSLSPESQPPPNDGPLPVVPTVALVSAVVIDGIAIAWLLSHPGAPHALWVAAAIHVAVALPLILKRAFPPSQRVLSVSLALALPLIGAAVAAVALGTRGRSEVVDAPPDEEEALPPLENADAKHLAAALSCCEALLSSSVDERRAILGALNRRADANAIRILRWALGAADNDLAVEAALALEDIGAAFETRLFACREELAARPSFAAALAVAETIAQGIEVGIVDEPLVPSLAQDARAAYEQAATLDPARYDVLAVSRAQMEISLLRSDNALELIDRALPTASEGAREQLLALRQEAALASHSLPWEGSSALATYRPAQPPRLTSRRAALLPAARVPGVVAAAGSPERSKTSPRVPLYPILGAEVSHADG